MALSRRAATRVLDLVVAYYKGADNVLGSRR
jgi:hypothetical protein